MSPIRHSLILSALLMATACATAPKINSDSISQNEATSWLQHYCSKLPLETTGELSGEIVIRGNTKEFKGQFPGSLHFSKPDRFILEITNILGGTLARMEGSGNRMNIEVPSKPNADRTGIASYLGLEVPVLMELLHGDLPCPYSGNALQTHARANGNKITIPTKTWTWNFERAADSMVPVQLTLNAFSAAKPISIVMRIEDWDQEGHYARKVEIQSPDGFLKWTWRNRDRK